MNCPSSPIHTKLNEMNNSPKRIVVVGAGIGGLTAAIAFKKAGHAVFVLEKANELRAIGAGLSLQMNAMAALNSIGRQRSIQW